ncbi:hypothetical protein IWW51_000133 [Coemansia sp. RSA 2702]|nr:hypothetical protein IWW51_000133 [Coemansia sp. RSA 2702]
MPNSKKKKTKPAPDLRGYATVSVPSKAQLAARTPSRSRSKERPLHTSPTTAAAAESEPEPPASPETRDPATVDAWVSIDVARRKASERMHHEQSLKARFDAFTRPALVQVSAAAESHIVDGIRAGSLPVSSTVGTETVPLTVREWTQSANCVIETLLLYGFSAEDVGRAMEATHGTCGLMDVLGWLCIHVPADQMPVRMRDKLEFGELRATTVEPSTSSPVRATSSEPAPTPDLPSDSPPNTPEQQPDNDVDEASVVLTPDTQPAADRDGESMITQLVGRLRIEDFGMDDAYDSDEDPGVVCGRRHVRASSLADLLDYLQTNNHKRQYEQTISTVREYIGQEKTAISALEHDLIYHPERAEAEFNRLWPAYRDRLLDDICRIKVQQDQVLAAAAELPEPLSTADASESDSDASECGFAALFDEEQPAEQSTREAQGDLTVLSVVPPRGWTGVSVRELVDQAVHHFDKQAVVRFSTARASSGGGFTGSVRITWSQPAKAAAIGRAQRELPGAGHSADMLDHQWWLPRDIAGHAARDARDMAALVLLYMQPTIGHQASARLPPALRGLWRQWEAAEQHKQQARKAAEQRERTEFLRLLYTQYQAAIGVQTDDDKANDVPEARTGRSASNTARACSVRARTWTAATIPTRQSQTEWVARFGAARMRLPVSQHRSAIVAAFESSQVIIVRGETGSGKSSQVPQFLLQSLLANPGYTGGRIMCTQPRRISATSIATRVSQELGDREVGTTNSLVGFQIRLSSRSRDENALVFCTTGVLLRMLVDDPELSGVSCVVCDEVQERTIDFDYLLIVLRRLLARRADLRVVLMSATIDVGLFSMYFDGCPVVDVPGRSYPVRSMFLEDIVEESGYVLDPAGPYAARDDTRRAVTARGEYVDVRMSGEGPGVWSTISRMRADRVDLDLIAHLLRGMCAADNEPARWAEYCRAHVPAGGVLVFLPGIYEIRRLALALQSDAVISRSALVIPLHSAFAGDRPGSSPMTYQELAFAAAPAGRRKIVLATNVAETGITIPDVTVVVDCGLANQMVYDAQRRIERLQTQPISRASARQRRGRAGRVQPGLALSLFTTHEHSRMREFELPEIQRLPLASLCLLAKSHGVHDIMQFLQLAVEPPRQSSVAQAVHELQTAGALDEDEELTPIGRHLGFLPVDLCIGKLLVYSALLGCLESVVTVAAAHSLTSGLLLAPYDARDKQLAAQAHAKYRRHATDGYAGYLSDFMLVLAVYRDWTHTVAKPGATAADLDRFCAANWLSRDAFDKLEDLREQYLRLLHERALITYERPSNSTARGHPWSVSRAIRPRGSMRIKGFSGFARVPKSANSNDLPAMVAAVIVAAMDHLIMPAPKSSGFVIGQSTVTRRVDGIGAAIQVRERTQITPRPIHLNPQTLANPPPNDPLRHALVAASLTGSATQITAHTLTRASLAICCLFARSLEFWPHAQLLIVDRWIWCKCAAKSAL